MQSAVDAGGGWVMNELLGLPLGIHRDVPESVYHAPAFGVVSKSALDRVARSPAHYLHWSRNPGNNDSPALAFGRAFHCAVLEPDKFASQYAVTPEEIADAPTAPKPWSSRRAACKRWVETRGDVAMPEVLADDWDNLPQPAPWDAKRAVCKAWINEHPNAISRDDHSRIVAMQAVLRGHPLVSQMLKGGDSEVTVTWEDEDTGLMCKSRADYYVPSRRMVVDLKTTADASHDSFRKSIANYRYYVQDALYRAAFAAAGEPVEHFVMVAIEKEPPHGVGIYTLDHDGIATGYAAARRDIQALADALKSDEWPGYPPHINTVDLPPWAA